MTNPVINPVINPDGSKYWYNSDGVLHREDGPAIEGHDGIKEWCINGYLHRDDGPAIEDKDGTKYWYIDGYKITDEVNQWILDNNFPEYEKWDDSIKVLFKLTFG